MAMNYQGLTANECTLDMHLWDEDEDDYRSLNRLRKIEGLLGIGPLNLSEGVKRTHHKIRRTS